jgi:putative FmdB family regulatory protein
LRYNICFGIKRFSGRRRAPAGGGKGALPTRQETTMPIYEYRCSACGHELETLQKITESPLVNCPSCRADALTKLVSAAGFQLKGTGWYATDFRNSGSKPAAKPEAKTNGAGDAKTNGAGDAKTNGGGDAKTDKPADSKSESTSTAPAAGCGTGCACH